MHTGIRYAVAAWVLISTSACDRKPDNPIGSASGAGSGVDEMRITYVSSDSAQRTPRYSCPACKIEFEYAADAGFEHYGPGRGSEIVRDSAGRFWMSCTFDNCGVAVYDSAGKFLSAVGGYGGGPTERKWIHTLTAHGGELYLADPQNQRIDVADGSFKIIRTIHAPYSMRRLTVSRDGTIAGEFLKIVNGVPFGAHLLSDSGSYLQAIGAADSSGLRDDGYIKGDQELAFTQSGSLVVASAAAYTMKEYVEGRLRRTLSDDIPWFDAYKQKDATKWPRLISISVDSLDQLWVLITLPTPGYKASPPTDPNGFIGISDMHGLYDTVIEVWDLKSGRLKAGARIDQHMSGFADASHMYTHADGPNGDYIARIFRMKLVGVTPLPSETAARR